MENTVRAEGDKEKELFDKYMCYCKTGGETLGKSLADANTKVPQVQSSIEAAEANKANLASDVKAHQTDRDAAKTAMAEATHLRETEAAAFAAEKAEAETNLAALAKATAAIEKGMSGSFLQTAAAGTLRKLMSSTTVSMGDYDRETVTAFLSEDQSESDDDSYAPASGQITGILKQMHDTMTKDLDDTTAAENNAIKLYGELMAAKTKEVQAATDAIEKKTVRIGELGVEIVMMKEDLSDTEQALIEDTKFLADLEKNCKTVGADYEARQATRAEELVAIADTIKVLNDDDALELFKKTLPGASALLQVSVRKTEMKSRALALVQEARKLTSPRQGRGSLDFIAMALSGKKVDFSKVLKMVDELVAVLKTEQQDDNHKREYCEGQFDVTEDKKKGLEHDLSDLAAAIDEMKSSIATLVEEIAALGAGIKALDKSVAEATEQRKEEHEDFESLMAGDTAAQDILGFAKNRLNKFYNPKLYKAPPKRELTEEDRQTLAAGGTLAPTEAPWDGSVKFVQISAHVQHKDAPAAPPAIGTYSSKGEESNGVIGMIDSLIADLEKEMTEAQTTEKDAQGDYEQMMADSAEKRAEDSKTIADKSGAKAALEEDLANANSQHSGKTKEAMATAEYLGSLHAECDWLIQNFDLRKSARAGEIDSLTKAKAVLSGADYSLLQKSRKTTFLRKNKAVGACMDMCAEIHSDKSLQQCQAACGGDVTYGNAETSVMCMHMCTEALGNHPSDCQHKC